MPEIARVRFHDPKVAPSIRCPVRSGHFLVGLASFVIRDVHDAKVDGR